MTGLNSWIFKWKRNGFRNAQGEAVKNAGIIRCTSIHLDIRDRNRQKIHLQHVKGHSGDVGNDGADALANRGALLPAVEERDWEALALKLLEQLEQSYVETSGIESVPVEVQDMDDVVEDTAVEIPSSKMRKTSPDSYDRTTMAIATSSAIKPVATEASPLTSSRSTSNLLPVSAPRDVSPAQCSGPQSIPLESPATVSQTNFETIRNKKVSLKVIYALPPFVPVKYEEVNFDVGELVFAHHLYLTLHQDYADCVLDDEELAKELSD